MPSYVIIGDSHLKLVNLNQVQGDATVIARYRISEQILATYRHKNVCFLFVGGNDISFHSTYNPRPKTTQQTADRIISCQIFIEILFRAPKFLKRLKRMLQPDLTIFSCEKMFADIYLITFSNNCNLTTFYEVCNDITKTHGCPVLCLEFYQDSTVRTSRLLIIWKNPSVLIMLDFRKQSNYVMWTKGRCSSASQWLLLRDKL